MIVRCDVATPEKRTICPARTQNVVATELDISHLAISYLRPWYWIRPYLQAVPKRVTNRPATNGVQVELRLGTFSEENKTSRREYQEGAIYYSLEAGDQ